MRSVKRRKNSKVGLMLIYIIGHMGEDEVAESYIIWNLLLSAHFFVRSPAFVTFFMLFVFHRVY